MQHGNSRHKRSDFPRQRHRVHGDNVRNSIGFQQNHICGRFQTTQIQALLDAAHFGRGLSFGMQGGGACRNERNGIDSIQEIVASSFSSTLERIHFSISEAVAWGQIQRYNLYTLLFLQRNTLLYRQYSKSHYGNATFTPFQTLTFRFPHGLLDLAW